jgi:hypothetical protein
MPQRVSDMAGSYEHGNEHFGSVKNGHLLDQLLGKDSAVLS